MAGALPMSDLMLAFRVDTANSDDEYLYVDVFGGATICIKRTDEGVIVDMYSSAVKDDAVATMGATWNEIIPSEELTA